MPSKNRAKRVTSPPCEAGARNNAEPAVKPSSKKTPATIRMRSLTQSEQRLKSETAALSRLNEASARLWQTQDLNKGLDEILAAAIELLSADFGNIQLFDPNDGVLRIAVHRGFKRPFLEYFREVSAKENAACGRALRSGRRIIIEDVEKDAAFAPHRAVARSAGYRAVQSTPLIARDGRPLGMISTHFRAPHRPGKADLQSLDLYAHQAADFIERCDAEQALTESRESSLAVVDALSAHIAVVDEKGNIVKVNESWRRFARRNRGVPETMNEGANYVSACEKAARDGSDDAAKLLKGMRDVLAGKVREFSFEYPCHAPDKERWFIVRVTRVTDGGRRGVVFAHEDITGRKEAELALRRSEQRLQKVLEIETVGVMFWDLTTGCLVDANETFLKMMGYTRADIASRKLTWQKFTPREYHDVSLAEIRRFHAHGRIGPYEKEYLRKDGTRQWFVFAGSSLGGNAAVEFCVDISARKDAEAALRDQKDLLRAVTESTPDLIFAKDRESRWLMGNPAAFAVIGKTASEVIGRSEAEWHDDPGQAAVLHATDRRIMKSGVAETIEEAFTSCDGQTRTYESTKSPMRDASGRIVGIVGVAREITALKVAEESLRVSMHQIRTLSHAVEQSPAIVVITTPTGEIDYVNRKFTEVTGYTLEEVLGKNPRILKSGDQPEAFYKEMWDTITAGREWRGEFCNKKKSGERFWEYAVIAPVTGSDGRVQHFVAIKEDITERRQALATLRDREERLRAILNAVVDAVITIDRHGVITNLNPATERMFGYTEAEMIGRNVKMLMPSPYSAEHDRYLDNYHRTGVRKIIGIGREVQAQRKDGTTFSVDLAVSEVDHMGLFTGVIRDISERRKLEQALLDVIEREQRRLGEELHDGLGQHLTGLEMLSHALALDLEETAPKQARRARKLNEELRDTITLTRLISHGLAPLPSNGEGLMEGLEKLAQSTARIPGKSCHFTCVSPVMVDNPAVAMHLYRIAQEAVNNALKHGKARKIEITLRELPGTLELRVENNGRTFRASDLDRSGLGLSAMRHRASVIGATLVIEPSKRSGARVVCTLRKLL